MSEFKIQSTFPEIPVSEFEIQSNFNFSHNISIVEEIENEQRLFKWVSEIGWSWFTAQLKNRLKLDSHVSITIQTIETACIVTLNKLVLIKWCIFYYQNKVIFL